MVELNNPEREADLLYARGLWIGTAFALALIAVETFAYVTGIVSPYIPLPEPACGLEPADEGVSRRGESPGRLGLGGAGGPGRTTSTSSASRCSPRLRLPAMYGCWRISWQGATGSTRRWLPAQIVVMLVAASGLLNSH